MKSTGKIRFLPAGRAWAHAFQEALDFLRKENSLLLLGPQIGDAGRAWLETEVLREQNLLFGERILGWKEYVKGRARKEALTEGHGFVEFNLASRRDYLRILLRELSKQDAFHQLQNLWEEERFFSALVDTVDELRAAGLTRSGEIERARELLEKGDEVYRGSYEDLWNLLAVFEAMLPGAGGDRFDWARMLEFAKEGAEGRRLFLLGFDHLTLLEVELLQELARSVEITLAVEASAEEIHAAVEQKETEPVPILLALRSLATNFSGNFEIANPAEAGSPSWTAPILAGHTPAEEARAAGAFLEFTSREKKADCWRVVAPRDYFQSRTVKEAFQGALGKRITNYSTPLDTEIGRWLLQSLSLKAKNYELDAAADFAQLLSFTWKRSFVEIPTIAMRAGIRRGLKEWHTKFTGAEGVLRKEFLEALEKLDTIFPAQGSAIEFESAFEKFLAWLGLAELAKKASSREEEREAHGTLAAFVRNAAMLSAATHSSFSLQAWLTELQALLSRTPVAGMEEGIPLYGLGEWVPAGENSALMALGLTRDSEPGISFTFYLEENARRRLSEFLLRSRVGLQLAFRRYIAQLANSERAYLSFHRLNAVGKETTESWALASAGGGVFPWPEVHVGTRGNFLAAESQVVLPEAGKAVEKFSATWFNAYKACPYKAYAEQVLRLEDRSADPELDVPRLEEGTAKHEALRLFYKERNGRNIPSAEERARVLEECLRQAMRKEKLEYYKGSDALFETHLTAVARKLAAFVEADIAYLDAHPDLTRMECERVFEGELAPGIPYKAKVDREDWDEKNKHVLVLDYKSSTTPDSKSIKEGKNFQLQLYMDALEKAEPGAKTAGGLFVSLSAKKRNQGIVNKRFNNGAKKEKDESPKYFSFNARTGALVDEVAFQELRAGARQAMTELAVKIRAGEFIVRPEDRKVCKDCAISPACRVREFEFPRGPEPASRAVMEEKFGEFWRGGAGSEKSEEKAREFTDEQKAVLERVGKFTFVEASAGTGKTTVLVERLKCEMERLVESGISPREAAEKIHAISFTEKSAEELSSRVSRILMEKYGAEVAALAIQNVTTIHGFCRKVVSDFPIEARVNPLFTVLDEVQGSRLLRETLDEFFLDPTEESRTLLTELFTEYDRRQVEAMLVTLVRKRSLVETDIEGLLTGRASEFLLPEGERLGLLKSLLGLNRLLLDHYDRNKAAIPAVDFNDLERLAGKVLREEAVGEYYRDRIGLLLVDEFQDTNPLQREMIDRIARAGRRNLVVVGDAKQSIYRFRDADVSVFQNLRKEAVESGALCTLSKNFRSQKHVVEFANELGRKIFPKDGEAAPSFEATFLESEAFQKPGEKVKVLEYSLLEGEKAREVTEPKLLVRTVEHFQAKGYAPEEIAVLFRRFSGNGEYLRELSRAGISFTVGASSGFFAQSEVVDGIAFLRALYGEHNDLALYALLKSPWFRVSDEDLHRIAKKEGFSLWQKLDGGRFGELFRWRERVKTATPSSLVLAAYRTHPLYGNTRERLQMEKLVTLVEEWEREGASHAEMIGMLSASAGWGAMDSDGREATVPEGGARGAISLLTVHAAKGLEFPVVILPDLDATARPDNSRLRFYPGLGASLSTPKDSEDDVREPTYAELGKLNGEREAAESKRLFYVAVTRAKKEMLLFVQEKESKGKTWGDWVRDHASEKSVERIRESHLLAGTRVAKISHSTSEPLTVENSVPQTTSISELAAFQFCPEFHRLKFVQAWDDRVVDLWKKPKNHFQKFKNRKKTAPDEIAGILRVLGLERKDRGIALHRVLERIQRWDDSLEQAELWLKQSYENQGASIRHRKFSELLEMDLAVLRKFLHSPVGRELFSEGDVYPEIPFLWSTSGVRIHGAIDRLVKKSESHWIVVDYKSSILAESLERYLFQVASYGAAIRAWLVSEGVKNPRVDGLLVNIFSAETIPVPVEEAAALAQLERELRNVQRNYTDPGANSPKPGEHCFSCPYSLHCAIGRETVLES